MADLECAITVLAYGRTQQQIAEAVGVPQQTVSEVLARITRNSTRGKSRKRQAPLPPEGVVEEREEEEPAGAEAADKPRHRIDVSCYLPLLNGLMGEGRSVEPSGRVDFAPTSAPGIEPNAQVMVDQIVSTLQATMDGRAELPALDGPVPGRVRLRGACRP